MDIIKTFDNKFVEAHDWRKWNIANGYKSDAPVSLKTFMIRKTKGKSSPLSMQEINDWFASH